MMGHTFAKYDLNIDLGNFMVPLMDYGNVEICPTNYDWFYIHSKINSIH